MSRLVVFCRHPYHLRREEARAWLAGEIEGVLRRDELRAARLTAVRPAAEQAARDWDWLIEFQLDGPPTALGPAGACAELLADLRLLGMAPSAAIADDSHATELRP